MNYLKIIKLSPNSKTQRVNLELLEVDDNHLSILEALDCLNMEAIETDLTGVYILFDAEHREIPNNLPTAFNRKINDYILGTCIMVRKNCDGIIESLSENDIIQILMMEKDFCRRYVNKDWFLLHEIVLT